ncbi:hypothetical protein C1N61_30620 (plasmid) [Priestia aryabhattai]
MIIRKCLQKDYYLVNSLLKENMDLHQKELPHIFKTNDIIITDQEYTNKINNTDLIMYLAEDTEGIKGLIICKLKNPSSHKLLNQRRIGFITDLIITEKSKRKGIGKLLFRKLKEELKLKNIEYIELTVWGFNKDAMDFYKKLGMDEISNTLSMKI